MTAKELLQRIEEAAANGRIYLDLSGKQLTELPPEIANLSTLERLDLRENQLTALPPEFGQLSALQVLDLRQNQLTALPPEFGQLSALQVLDLRQNQLTALPPELGQLRALKKLSLWGNQLTALPPEFGQLRALQYLLLSQNQLTALPQEFGQLRALQHLELIQNQLTALPPELGQLRALQYLNLRQNQLTALPPELGQLRALKKLSLWGNQLTALPPEFGQLRALQHLDLSQNQLIALPPEFGQLSALQDLYLGGNRLTALPPEFGRLRALELLDLSQNQLTALPPDLGQLRPLLDLDLSKNQLTGLPLDLGRLHQLWRLGLAGNPLACPPPEILQQGCQGILAFLQELQDGSSQQWRSKLILVGEGGVGKTSLLRALKHEPFVEGLDTTHGIQTSMLNVPHPENDAVSMHLQSWDFGGQEIYHATHQFFLTDRSLFVLVWNARHGYEQGKIYYWLDQIQARAPQSPVLIAATHLDQRPADLPKDELRAKYPQIVAFYSVSSKKHCGIEEIRKAIALEAARLPLMGQKWPSNWLKAAEDIRASAKKHIRPRQLYEMMKARHVSAYKVLARWLHELGDILYFDDDEDLQNLVILAPQWVTEYISKVLESEDVSAQNGIFTREHEQQLWSDIAPEMQDHFLRLMEKFDLSYRTLENRDISLVVERLALDPPDYAERWDSLKSCEPFSEMTLIYRLSTLPAGIPTWFIARTHRFTTHTHWRSGAIFGDDREQPKHLALLRAFAHDRCLSLTVRGPSPHNFFTLLKDGIEETLKRYPGLEIKRFMPCPGHNGQACKQEFNYAQLQKALEQRPPVTMMQCSETFEMVSVPGLLFGVDWNTQDAVLKRLSTLEATMTEEHARQSEELRNLRELTQRQFLNSFRQLQSDIDSACPNVFVLRPCNSSGWQKTVLGQRFWLQLYCQQPGSWHPTEEGGCYEIRLSAEWINALGPYLRNVVQVLKFISPLVGPWMSMSAPDYKALLKEDVSMMTALVKTLPDLGSESDPDLSDLPRAERSPERAAGAALRALRQLLEEKDPQQHWGGLKKVLTPEGHYLWLCRHHAQDYAR
ncbi:GTPase [candidate division KSB3 bacterium]|uniref:non-specific serine/threonine protein kinase n=1 Tax=candidate division KSB3 bacterium TaxID=2044937 RepID=A0A2G6E9H2_9BACT|nr:MAG: GTPase [candidate division KSB3 bacterium]PIE29555.1 MAG: GTPase [candidate division KSB3 bacterium]